jgi:hypothetical protein
VPPIDLQTGVPTDAYNLDEAVKDFRTDLAAFLASDFPHLVNWGGRQPLDSPDRILNQSTTEATNRVGSRPPAMEPDQEW